VQSSSQITTNKLCGRPPQYPPPPQVDLDLLTLKVVSEWGVMWPTSVPILVFLGLSCSRLRPDVHDRQTDVRHTSSFNASTLWGHNKPTPSFLQARCPSVAHPTVLKHWMKPYGRYMLHTGPIQTNVCNMYLIRYTHLFIQGHLSSLHPLHIQLAETHSSSLEIFP